ncbi:metal transporter Nramp6 [Trifolium repens]|nr:metal transporter Nramp6 [Trifolium repens]
MVVSGSSGSGQPQFISSTGNQNSSNPPHIDSDTTNSDQIFVPIGQAGKPYLHSSVSILAYDIPLDCNWYQMQRWDCVGSNRRIDVVHQHSGMVDG